DLHSVFNGLSLRQRPAVEHRAQAFALEKLGDQKRRAFVLTNVEHRENIGMIERGHRPRLLLETTQAVRFTGEGFGKDFQSDIAPQARVPGAIHFAHSASAYWSEDFIGPEFRARGERHRIATL